MIRVNLLEIRQAKPEKKANLTYENAAGIAAVAIIVLSIAFVGYRSFAMSRRIATLKAEVEAATEELSQLQEALQVIESHQKKKAALKKRVELITELKRRQKVPVHLLDQISRKLPAFLWLEGLDERDGRVVIRGKATTYNAVSNFYNNLAGSPYFKDVTLGNTQAVPEGVSFNLSCRFQTADETAGAGGDAAAGTPRG
ncbi:MAG: hypothetical protein D6718_00430 [Acidobacteria bacterium]|nr:MAG: hypothetical protein D6718_00430 [Acidobacteriota bacterium]